MSPNEQSQNYEDNNLVDHLIYAGGKTDWTEGQFVKLEFGMHVWSPYTWSWLTLHDTPRNREEMTQPHNHGFAVTCNAWFEWTDDDGGTERLDCSRVSSDKFTN